MTDGVPARLRRALMVLVVLGMLGVAVELVLLEHYEDTAQWIPLAAVAVGFATAVAAALRPGRTTLRVLRWVMGGFLVVGALGVYLHLRGNVEFELEMDADLRGARLLWESLRGATPALAPSAMAYLGLLGLLSTWGHPGLDGPG